jgi:hypothetical protein
MPFTIDTTITCYLLPGDGPTAEADFLQHLTNMGETWVIAYAFTLPDMINDLITAHQKGVKLHLYLDHSQSTGKAEAPLLQKLLAAGIEITIGTSPEGSAYICHTKGIVSDAAAGGGQPWCWEGSTNFSLSAWKQVNTAMVFSSLDWRNDFVAQFEALRDYAWANEKSMQIMSSPPPDLGAAPAANRARYGLKPKPAPGDRAGGGGTKQNAPTTNAGVVTKVAAPMKAKPGQKSGGKAKKMGAKGKSRK